MWFIFCPGQKKNRAKDGVRESASEHFLKIGASNTGLEKKLNMFSVTLKKTSVKEKKALILQMEEEGGGKKSTDFPSCPNHTQTQEGYKCHSWKNAPQTSAFIHFDFFFFSKWQKTQLTGFTFVYLLLTLHV